LYERNGQARSRSERLRALALISQDHLIFKSLRGHASGAFLCQSVDGIRGVNFFIKKDE
jgi:hypothetical protein